MAIVISQGFREDLEAGNVTDAAVVRVLAVMAGSTAEDDMAAAIFVDDVGTLNEFDGVGYTRQTIGSVTVTHTSALTTVAGDAISFGATVAAGSDPIVGFVYYRFVTNDADSVVWAFNDSGDLPNDPGGAALTLDYPDGFITEA